jgi:DNA-binding SARP family transcriptional activator/DNA-binding beta-propeller fold protein YncE
MEFWILGPLEIVEDGRPLTLRGTKKRALLALLLLHANEVVSQERLIEDLWGERRPETAATAVHGYVSQLRKLLEPTRSQDHPVLVTRAPGYELRVDPETLDLQRFEQLAEDGRRLLAAGDAQAAAATLEEALSLWRGRPLAEFEASPFALVESLRLEELRVSVIEDRVQADLALGRHAALIPELETLVAERPHDERLCGYLMLALYRSGRQAEALATYQRTRHALVDELGIEPSSMLQQLERAILNHEPSLELPHDANRGSESADAVLVGPRPRTSRRVFIVGALGALAAALGVAFALRDEQVAATRLAHNSVGFIDESGRVTPRFPIGQGPHSLMVANNSLWVANYRDQTVMRIDLATKGRYMISMPGLRHHPTGIAAFGSTIWVATLEGLLVPIAFDRAGDPIDLGSGRPGGIALGEIAAGGGYLWVTAPETTVIRLNPGNPEDRVPIFPNTGAESVIAFHEGEAWSAGSGQVLPIAADTGISRTPITVGGSVRDMAFGGDSLWVVSGRPASGGGVVPALRPVDLQTRLLRTTIDVGDRPVAVAATPASIWVASRNGNDGVIYRVDPAHDRVVDTISVGSIPTALAPDDDGVWVAVD